MRKRNFLPFNHEISLYYLLLKPYKKLTSHSKNHTDWNNSELNYLFPHIFDFAPRMREDNWHLPAEPHCIKCWERDSGPSDTAMKLHLKEWFQSWESFDWEIRPPALSGVVESSPLTFLHRCGMFLHQKSCPSSFRWHLRMMPSALSTCLGRKCAERSLCRTSSEVALAKAEARNEGQLLEKKKRNPRNGVLVWFSKVT